jgi:hypothetical protein
MVVVFTTSLAFCMLPITPLVDDYLLASPMEKVWLASVIILVMLALTLVGWLLLCAGAMWCPAAISSMTNLTARMVSGYVAQMLIFGTTPKLLTLLGAASMLAGVAVVMLLKVQLIPSKAPGEASLPAESAREETPETQKTSPDATPPFANDDNDSLASFIAAEYVSFRSHEQSDAGLRRRHDTEPAAEAIGASL